MTNENILKKAIEKVVKHGWKDKNKYRHLYTMIDLFPKMFFEKKEYYSIIFSHDFAKAFWGTKKVCSHTGLEECFCQQENIKWIPTWQYHLQIMILKEKPLRYIKKFL